MMRELKRQPEKPDTETDEARREALRKLGKFASYTAPAMLAMFTSEAAAQFTF